VGKRLMWR